MKRAELDNTTCFKFVDVQELEDEVGPDGRPRCVRRYEEIATGHVFQVCEATNEWRMTGESDRADLYGRWRALVLR